MLQRLGYNIKFNFSNWISTRFERHIILFTHLLRMKQYKNHSDKEFRHKTYVRHKPSAIISIYNYKFLNSRKGEKYIYFLTMKLTIKGYLYLKTFTVFSSLQLIYGKTVESIKEDAVDEVNFNLENAADGEQYIRKILNKEGEYIL